MTTPNNSKMMTQQQLQPWHIFSAVFVAFWAIMSYFDSFFITLILCVGAGFATDNLNKYMKGTKSTGKPKKPVVDLCPTKPLPPEPPAVSSDEEEELEDIQIKVPDSLPIQQEPQCEVEPTPSPQLMESVVPPTELLSEHQIPEDIMEIEEEETAKCDENEATLESETKEEMEDFVEVKKIASITPHNSFAEEPEADNDLMSAPLQEQETMNNEAVFEEAEEVKEQEMFNLERKLAEEEAKLAAEEISHKEENNLLIEETHDASDQGESKSEADVTSQLIDQIEQPPQMIIEDSLLLSQEEKVDLLEDNLMNSEVKDVAESVPSHEIENKSVEVLSNIEVKQEQEPLISAAENDNVQDAKHVEVIEEEITELKISAKNEEPVDFLGSSVAVAGNDDQSDLLGTTIPPPPTSNTEDSLLDQIEVKGDLLSGMDDSLLVQRSEEDDIPVMMTETNKMEEVAEEVDLLNIQSEQLDPTLVQHVAKTSLEEHEQELANLLNEAQQEEEVEPELEAVEKVVKDEGDLWALDEPKLGGESLVHLGDSDELANKDDISHCAVFGDDIDPDLDLDEDEKAPRSLKSSTSSSSAGPDVADQDDQQDHVMPKKQASTDSSSSSSEEANPKDANLLGNPKTNA